jgi:hypothetical protein
MRRISRQDLIGGLLLSTCVFAVMNYFNFAHKTFSADFDVPYRRPFAFFRDGGFPHDAMFVWPGLVGDLRCLLAGRVDQPAGGTKITPLINPTID